MATKKKGGGGNLSRSQVVTVRFDPKLKFAAEIAARKQRRTISSFIEWVVEEAISRIEIAENSTISNVLNQVWDVEEADRFVKLALKFPDLLTYEEERLWKVLTDFEPFWKGKHGAEFPFVLHNEEHAYWDLIRFNWKTLQKIVEGEADTKDLSEVPY